MSESEANNSKEGLKGFGCLLTGVSCVAGVAAGLVSLIALGIITSGAGRVFMLLALPIAPVSAFLYMLVGRAISEPFCSTLDWAFKSESSFKEFGIVVAAIWPLALVFLLPVVIFGCVNRLF